MKRDLIEELRVADPARARDAEPAPDWDAMQARIVAVPRRTRRRRVTRVLAPVAVAAAVASAIIALTPGGAPPSVLERAYSAASQATIYHYVVTTQELEGPQRRALDDTRSTREGWIDPTTGEIHEIAGGGDEWVTDGRRRTMYTAFNNSLMQFDEPPASAAAGLVPGDVLRALTRSYRAGRLRDEGVELFEGQRVRRLVAYNPGRTLRQTFLIDAKSFLPVLFRLETGDYIRTGAAIPTDQRIIEQHFDRFERLPDDSDRTVLKMREHPGAQSLPGGGPPLPRPAGTPSRRR